MSQKSNPQREEGPKTRSICSSSLQEKFAQYERFIQNGYRLFSESYNDDCQDEWDDDDADCNYFNCC